MFNHILINFITSFFKLFGLKAECVTIKQSYPIVKSISVTFKEITAVDLITETVKKKKNEHLRKIILQSLLPTFKLCINKLILKQNIMTHDLFIKAT